MLQITIPEKELWDEHIGEFIYIKEHTLQMEHSLISISKWETKWKKPFLTKDSKPIDETLDYFKCMTLTQNVNPLVYLAITDDIFETINSYLEDPMTATTFSKQISRSVGRETVTSELIYYWMVALNIPFECQKWHLNRLLTVIQICNIKNQPNKKMNNKEIASRNAAINAARRKRLNNTG